MFKTQQLVASAGWLVRFVVALGIGFSVGTIVWFTAPFLLQGMLQIDANDASAFRDAFRAKTESLLLVIGSGLATWLILRTSKPKV
jgi:hypothetical protein